MIPFKYDRISQFNNKAFLVHIGNDQYTQKCGIIDTNNTIIIPLINREIEKFGSGYLVDKENDSTAVFDSTGTRKSDYARGYRLTYPVWDMGYNHGYIVYNEKKRDFIHYQTIRDLMYYDDNKWGRLDADGTEVVQPQYDAYRYMMIKGAIAVQKNKKWGVISYHGETIIPFEYDYIKELDNSLLLVRNEGKFGVINNHLKIVVPVKYDDIALTELVGVPVLSVSINKKQSYFDLSGKEINP